MRPRRLSPRGARAARTADIAGYIREERKQEEKCRSPVPPNDNLYRYHHTTFHACAVPNSVIRHTRRPARCFVIALSITARVKVRKMWGKAAGVGACQKCVCVKCQWGWVGKGEPGVQACVRAVCAQKRAKCVRVVCEASAARNAACAKQTDHNQQQLAERPCRHAAMLKSLPYIGEGHACRSSHAKCRKNEGKRWSNEIRARVRVQHTIIFSNAHVTTRRPQRRKRKMLRRARHGNNQREI